MLEWLAIKVGRIIMISPDEKNPIIRYIHTPCVPLDYILIIGENGGYPPTKNGDIRSLLCA